MFVPPAIYNLKKRMYITGSMKSHNSAFDGSLLIEDLMEGDQNHIISSYFPSFGLIRSLPSYAEMCLRENRAIKLTLVYTGPFLSQPK